MSLRHSSVYKNILFLSVHYGSSPCVMCRVVCVPHCQVHVLNLVYELTEDGTCLAKHVGVVEDHIFRNVCNLCLDGLNPWKLSEGHGMNNFKIHSNMCGHYVLLTLTESTTVGAHVGAVGWGTVLQAASIPDGVIGIFHWYIPSGRTMALELTQPLTEMSNRNVSWG
jgi:hypothetical protein